MNCAATVKLMLSTSFFTVIIPKTEFRICFTVIIYCVAFVGEKKVKYIPFKLSQIKAGCRITVYILGCYKNTVGYIMFTNLAMGFI